MMLFVWLGIAFFGGLALFIFVPWTAARIAGEKWVDKVADGYVWLAQTAAHKSAIVERDGTLELVSKRFDPDIKADKDKEHGDPRHHRDGFNVVSRLRNKSFGLALSDRGEYVSPLLSEIGDKAWRAREEGEIGPASDEDMKDGIIVDARSRLVDVGRARHLTTGNATPEDGHESYLRTKISQEKFNERMSFGQTIMIVFAFLGSSIAMFWMTGQTDGSSGNGQTVVSFVLFAAAASKLDVVSRLREIGAAAWVLGWVLFVPIVAIWLEGIVVAILVWVGMLSVAMVIPGGIALMGPAIPKSIGLILSRGLWILAQLTVGKGLLVRRETGEYEYTRLQDADERANHDFEAELSDGKMLPIFGSRGDLYRFAWAPLGITEEKGRVNMDPITDNPPTPQTDGGETRRETRIKSRNKRQGYHALLPIPGEKEWLVTLPQLYSWCHGTAESQSIEQGRNKAFSDHGGEQQIGMIVFTVAVLAAAVFGGAMGILAAGGLG